MSDFRVKDLIAELSEVDPNLLVLIQKDPEGNGFFWGSGTEVAFVHNEALSSDRTDECVSEDEMREEEYDSEDFAACLVIFP